MAPSDVLVSFMGQASLPAGWLLIEITAASVLYAWVVGNARWSVLLATIFYTSNNPMTPVLYPAISDAGYPQMYCREHGIRFRLIRLFGMTEPKMGQYNTSEKQYEILLTALEMRYFVVPAETTVEEIATELGISTTTASERLQRHRRTS